MQRIINSARSDTMKQTRLFILYTFLLTFLTHGILLYLMRNAIIDFYHIGGILLYSVGGISPTVFALYFIFKKEDKTFQNTFITSLITLKYSIKYWLFSLLYPLFLGLLFVTLYAYQHATDFRLVTPWFYFIHIFLYAIFVGGLEEIGWRGYLQEKLEPKLSPLMIATFIGLLWALWHVPLLLMASRNSGFIDILPFLLGFFMFNLYLTFLYHKTRSVLLTIVFHASINATRRVTGFRNLITGSPLEYILIMVLIIIGYALLLWFSHKPTKKTHNNII